MSILSDGRWEFRISFKIVGFDKLISKKIIDQTVFPKMHDSNSLFADNKSVKKGNWFKFSYYQQRIRMFV